jgi:hypothetical protein
MLVNRTTKRRRPRIIEFLQAIILSVVVWVIANECSLLNTSAYFDNHSKPVKNKATGGALEACKLGLAIRTLGFDNSDKPISAGSSTGIGPQEVSPRFI